MIRWYIYRKRVTSEMGVSLVIEPVIHSPHIRFQAKFHSPSANMVAHAHHSGYRFFFPLRSKEMQTKCNATTKRKLIPKEKVNIAKSARCWINMIFEMSLAKRSAFRWRVGGKRWATEEIMWNANARADCLFDCFMCFQWANERVGRRANERFDHRFWHDLSLCSQSCVCMVCMVWQC